MNTNPLQEPLPLPVGFTVVEPPPPAPPAPKPKKPYKRKRGPKRRVGRPPLDRSPSPSKRDGKRSITVTVTELVYLHLKELRRFYKLSSMSKTIAKFIEPAFDKAFQDAITLQKIQERKEKEREETAARLAAYRANKGNV